MFLKNKEADSLENKSFSKQTVIATGQVVTEQELITKTQETVDEKGEKQQPERKRKKKKQLPLQVWLELRTSINQNTSVEITEMQDTSLVAVTEAIPKIQETVAK